MGKNVLLDMSSIIILTPADSNDNIDKDFCYHLNPDHIISFRRVRVDDNIITVITMINGELYNVKEAPAAIDAYITYIKVKQNPELIKHLDNQSGANFRG